MRIFLGFLIAGIALGGVIWLHSGYKGESFELYRRSGITHHRKAAWQDPVALVLTFAGVGAGVAVVVSGFRRPVPD